VLHEGLEVLGLEESFARVAEGRHGKVGDHVRLDPLLLHRQAVGGPYRAERLTGYFADPGGTQRHWLRAQNLSAPRVSGDAGREVESAADVVLPVLYDRPNVETGTNSGEQRLLLQRVAQLQRHLHGLGDLLSRDEHFVADTLDEFHPAP
jgi:hypothetical protein